MVVAGSFEHFLMIPNFPQFKALEFSDKSDIDEFTSHWPSFSDFNFGSMWLWDHEGLSLVSKLNNNLVVRLSDGRTREPYYSFLGNSKADKTASSLIDFLLKQNLPPELNLVPEISAASLSSDLFEIDEDRDNFDYIYCTKELSTLVGGTFEDLRRKIRAFERNQHQFFRVDLLDPNNLSKLRNCIELWSLARSNRKPIYDDKICIAGENASFDRLFDSTELLPYLTCFGLFVDSVLAGFCIGEAMKDCFLCHFHKSNYKYAGTIESLFQQMARHLCGEGVSYINDEEDLGIEGLRFAKSRYRPVKFLKKYTVRAKLK